MTATDTTLAALQAITQLVQRGQGLQAAQRLEALLQTAPQDPRVHLLGAHMAEAAGHLTDAVAHARVAEQHAGRWTQPAVTLAQLLALSGELAEALAVAAQAVQRHPTAPEVVGPLADLALQAGESAQAHAWLSVAIPAHPPRADLLQPFAKACVQLGHVARAVDVFSTLLALNNRDEEARLGRLMAALQVPGEAGREAGRRLAGTDAEYLVGRRPHDPVARHWHQVTHGETPPQPPLAVVRAWFDNPLHDHAPSASATALAEAVAIHHPAATELLDLGCGTGALGRALAPDWTGRLVGVDLSPRRLDLAAQTGRYAELHASELVAHLASLAPASVGLVVLGEVLPWLGEATALPLALARVLRPGGRVLMTFECTAADEPALVLRGGLRYAHAPASVQAGCTQAGLAVLDSRPLTLGERQGQPVAGQLLVAGLPG